MTEPDRLAIAREEAALAREELAAAEHLVRSGLARIATTRVYFAVFHAIRASLYRIGVESRTHAGPLQMFNLHFVKPGLVDGAMSRTAARLQKYREEADYGVAFSIDTATATEELATARALIVTLEALGSA